MSRRGVIYRLYDSDGRLLYIGRTIRPPSQRMREHGDVQPWWDQVATGTMEFVPLGEVEAVERRAILAENPLHNLERHPVKKERRAEFVWGPLPDELWERLYRAGRRYARTATPRSQATLAALVYEGFMAGGSPMSVAEAASLGRDQARRYSEMHMKRHPELPRTPNLHGTGAAQRRARENLAS